MKLQDLARFKIWDRDGDKVSKTKEIGMGSGEVKNALGISKLPPIDFMPRRYVR